MKNQEHNQTSPEETIITKVKDQIVNEIRKENIVNFGIDILVVAFHVIAVSGLISVNRLFH